MPTNSERWAYARWVYRWNPESIDWDRMPRVLLILVFVKLLVTHPIETSRLIRDTRSD